MPRVSEFFGITIHMYYNDHMPPHFHENMASMKPFTRLIHWILHVAVFRVVPMHSCLNGQHCIAMSFAMTGNVRVQKSL